MAAALRREAAFRKLLLSRPLLPAARLGRQDQRRLGLMICRDSPSGLAMAPAAQERLRSYENIRRDGPLLVRRHYLAPAIS